MKYQSLIKQTVSCFATMRSGSVVYRPLFLFYYILINILFCFFRIYDRIKITKVAYKLMLTLFNFIFDFNNEVMQHMSIYESMMVMINFCTLMLNAVGLFVLIGNEKQTSLEPGNLKGQVYNDLLLSIPLMGNFLPGCYQHPGFLILLYCMLYDVYSICYKQIITYLQ